jgi:hypothetical protein
MAHDEDGFSEQPHGDSANRREGDESWDRDHGGFLEDKIQCIRRRKLSWLEWQFRDTHVLLLWLFCLTCSPVALVVGIVGLYTCELPEARQKARGTTIAAAIVLIIPVGLVLEKMLK